MSAKSLRTLILLLVFTIAAPGCMPVALPASAPAAHPVQALAAAQPVASGPATATQAPPPTAAPAENAAAPSKPAPSPDPIKLLAPDLAQPVTGAPEVRWEAVAGVPLYRVTIIDSGTSELLIQEDVAGTSVVLKPSLKPGHGYMLSIDGLDTNMQQVARFAGELRAAGTAADSADEPFVQLPGNCYRDGMLTYVDRTTRICFAYPQGFTLADTQGSQAQAEVRGPAIGSGPEPLFASLSIQFKPYQGQDLGPFVDELLKTEVPAGFPAKVERKQTTVAGHGAEVLEPMPGRLSSRTVVVDAAPQGFHILSFWPSFKDTAPDKLTAGAQQAQKDMNLLYETVMATFATLPLAGIPIDPAKRLDLPKSCLVAGQPLYINTEAAGRGAGGYCFAVTPDIAVRRLPDNHMEFYGPPLDKTIEPVQVGLGITTGISTQSTTLDKLADDWVAGLYKNLGPSVKRQATTMGGRPALRLDNTPGRPGAIEILTQQGDAFYVFRFTPDTTSEKGRTEVDNLIKAVTGSFGLLPTAIVAAAPMPAPAGEGSGAVRNAQHGAMSFTYAETLAKDAVGKTVPAPKIDEGGAPAWVYMPEYTAFELSGYILDKTAVKPGVMMFPAADYTRVSDEAGRRIEMLRNLLAQKPAVIAGELPYLPLTDAAQPLRAALHYVPFKSGEGIRYLTQMNQGPTPINNGELYYTFQGLTTDGKYYVSVILPVSHRSLPASAEVVPQAEREAIAGLPFQSYVREVTASLSGQPAASFEPSLADLDALVESIVVKP